MIAYVALASDYTENSGVSASSLLSNSLPNDRNKQIEMLCRSVLCTYIRDL